MPASRLLAAAASAGTAGPKGEADFGFLKKAEVMSWRRLGGGLVANGVAWGWAGAVAAIS